MKFKKFYPYVIIIFIAAIAYLPFLGKQGFYKDDWYQIWAGTTQGSSTLIKMFSIDRPGLGLLYALTHKLLGDKLICWHLFAFISRICVTILLYWLAKLILPEKEIPSILIAALAIIYPGYLEQPFANTSLSLFIAFGFCVFSILMSLQAYLDDRKHIKIVKTVLAVISGFIYVFIFEYLIGMELLRIFLFYFLQNQTKRGEIKTKKFWSLILQSIPYMFTMLVFMIWRFFIFKSARSTTDVNRVLNLYLTKPFDMVLGVISEFITGIYNAVIQAWTIPIYTLNQQLTVKEFITTLVVSIIFTIGTYFLIKNLNKHEEEGDDKQTANNLIKIGLAATIFAILPIILVGRKVNFDSTYIHYTFPLIFGVLSLVIGLLYQIIFDKKLRTMLISGLFCIAMFTQIANGIHYQKYWEMQKSLWWQLSWRAPGIKQDSTLVVFTPAAYRFAEAYEIWAPANLIYNQSEKTISIAAEVPNDQTIPLMMEKVTYGEELRRIEYVVDFKQMLIISAPHSGVCLHVFDGPSSEISSHEETEAKMVYSLSNAQLIDIEQPSKTVNTNIFGKEPEHTWCYFYQKASLARQKGDWAEIVELGLDVLEKNLQPVDLSEWMPFYEGFARGNRIDLANEVGALIRQDNNFILSYCNAQSNLDQNNTEKITLYLVTNLCPHLE